MKNLMLLCVAATMAASAASSAVPESRETTAARWIELLHSSLHAEYPGLADELGLAPEMAGQVFHLLAEAGSQKIIANQEIPLRGTPGSAESLQSFETLMTRRQEIERRRNEALAALLGSRYQQFRDFEDERPARTWAAELVRALASAGQPLRASQTRPVVLAYRAHQNSEREIVNSLAAEVSPADLPQRIAESMRMDEANVERQAARNRRLLDVVQPHLDTLQLQILETMLRQ